MNSGFLVFNLTMILCWALLIFSSIFVPFISRKNISFGVAIPFSEYKNDFFKKLRRSYSLILLISGIVLGTLSSLTPIWMDMNKAVWVELLGIAVYLVIMAVMYFKNYFKVKEYKQNSNWEIDTKVNAAIKIEKDERKSLSLWWFLTYAIIIIVTIAIAAVNYKYLPDQIPMHYDISGNVDRYAAKSIGSLMTMPVMQALLGIMFFGIFIGILKAKTQSDGNNIDESLRNDRNFRMKMANFIFIIGLFTLMLFLFIELPMLGLIQVSVMQILPILFLVLVFIFVVYLIMRVGQGGSRLNTSTDTFKNKASSSDKNWILGFIYINKEDPSIFVERRFGMGYTINLGNPVSIIILIVLVLLILALTIVPFMIK